AHFGRTEGLVSVDMSQNAFFSEPDGTVWLGTSRGLMRYHDVENARAPQAPPVVLVSGRAGGRALDPSRVESLSRSERDVELAFAALTFVDPRGTRFRYRLRDVDASPTETSLTEARFSRLSSGLYTFEVVATSAAGLTSPAPARFSFRVARAWWEEW